MQMANNIKDNQEKPKRGNPNWRKGVSGNPKGAAAGRQHINKRVIEALQHALDTAHPDGAEGYFLEIAKKKPELFVGMVQKVMPSQTDINVTVSIGDAMAEAGKRLAEYERTLIDITPEVVEPAPIEAKPLKVNDK